jgi:hypothetical protein
VTTATGTGVGADVDVEFLKLCGRVLLHPASRNTTKAGNLDLMIFGERWDWLTSSHLRSRLQEEPYNVDRVTEVRILALDSFALAAQRRPIRALSAGLKP